MTYGYITERCSCTAKFTAPALSASHATVWGNATALLKEWRENHRHEMPDEPTEPPTIVESGSSHERAFEPETHSDRVPTGFAREVR